MKLRAFNDENKASVQVASVFHQDGIFDITFDIVAEPLVVADEVDHVRRRDGLYRSTCAEIFVRRSESYLEFNFSPSGEWCVYFFNAYRQRNQMPIEALNPLIRFCREWNDGRLRLDLKIDLHAFFMRLNWSVNALLWQPTMVLDHGSDRSYWAIVHPGSSPDFHAFHHDWMSFEPNGGR